MEYLILTRVKLLKISQKMKNWNTLAKHYIPNRKTKRDYHQPTWINDNIKGSLKKRSELTIIFKKVSLWKSDHINVLEKPTEYTKKNP